MRPEQRAAIAVPRPAPRVHALSRGEGCRKAIRSSYRATLPGAARQRLRIPETSCRKRGLSR